MQELVQSTESVLFLQSENSILDHFGQRKRLLNILTRIDRQRNSTNLTYFRGKKYNPIEAIFLQHFSMTRHCLVLQKYLKLKYFILIYKLRHFLNIFLQDQWEKLLAVSICCCIIYVCYKELAIAGCKCF